MSERVFGDDGGDVGGVELRKRKRKRRRAGRKEFDGSRSEVRMSTVHFQQDCATARRKSIWHSEALSGDEMPATPSWEHSTVNAVSNVFGRGYICRQPSTNRHVEQRKPIVGYMQHADSRFTPSHRKAISRTKLHWCVCHSSLPPISSIYAKSPSLIHAPSTPLRAQSPARINT